MALSKPPILTPRAELRKHEVLDCNYVILKQFVVFDSQDPVVDASPEFGFEENRVLNTEAYFQLIHRGRCGLSVQENADIARGGAPQFGQTIGLFI